MMLPDKRREPRRRCDFDVDIRHGERAHRGRAFDLSRTGISIRISAYASLDKGDEVDIHAPELGWLQGRIVWRSPQRIGIVFKRSTNTTAKVESFLRSGALVRA
jgi:hypothetical protein